MRFRKISLEIIVALLIILFIYTGLNKMLDYTNFKFQLGRSPFIQSMSGFIAATLPAGEILVATLLVFKPTRMLGLYASFILMALFTGYIWLMLHYAYDLPCSCGGVLAVLSWKDHLIFNGVFTIISLIGILLQGKNNSITSSPTHKIA
ncbi:MauE/DoxX family redox-associated membrane protein [Chitinophaga defluvii]|uniref:MauE/DoxX family redox-associated membrane protein n=1 Tax=Chitinophaga defluvii TaxID=3163343 RepID=A0ABV2TAW8_9BACT